MPSWNKVQVKLKPRLAITAQVSGLLWAVYTLAARSLSQADVAALFLSRKILLSDFSEVCL